MPSVNRRQVIQGIVGSGAVGLAGCTSSNGGGSGSNKSGNSSGSNQDTVSISYRDRESAFTKVAKAYNQAQNNVKVNATIKPENSKYQALISQINAGNAPEVIGLDVVYLPRFVQLGALADLTSFYKGLDYTNQIFEPLKKDFIHWDNKVYALPYWIDCSLYLYNKQYFKDAGLDPSKPPETWSEFKAACKKLKAAGYTPLSNTFGQLGLELFFFLPFVWANGGNLFNEKMTKSLIGQKPAVEALQFFIDLQNKGYTTDQTQSQNFTYPAFTSGKTAMAFSGSGVSDVKSQSKKVYENMGTAVFPKPKGGEHSSFLGGDCVVITEQTTKNDQKDSASKKYINWLHTKAGMNAQVKYTGYLPSLKSGFDGKYLKSHNDIYNGSFETALKTGHAPPMHPKLIEMQDPLNNALTNAIQGKQSAQKALSEAASKITTILQSS